MPCVFREQLRGQWSVAGEKPSGLYMGEKIRKGTRPRANCVRPCKWSCYSNREKSINAPIYKQTQYCTEHHGLFQD